MDLGCSILLVPKQTSVIFDLCYNPVGSGQPVTAVPRELKFPWSDGLEADLALAAKEFDGSVDLSAITLKALFPVHFSDYILV